MNINEVQKINRETLETIASFIEDNDYIIHYTIENSYHLYYHISSYVIYILTPIW